MCPSHIQEDDRASLSHIYHTALQSSCIFFLSVHTKASIIRKSGNMATLFKDEGETVGICFDLVVLGRNDREGFVV